ncbi:uncharacterized protein LOC115990043 [Quercus lobata]|uniref:uncharacterized protein LOC115990043 n=1 Tax=Quercus lobata TaxID=97700 RepID=UPI0012467844|nr:uncharacterized protein LOC115990043 [Quercus lobata]
MSLIEKVKSLESELSVAREQIDRTSTSKLDNMLNVQKYTSDKTGLGLAESVSASVVHPPKFVPAISISTPEVKMPKEEILATRKIRTLRGDVPQLSAYHYYTAAATAKLTPLLLKPCLKERDLKGDCFDKLVLFLLYWFRISVPNIVQVPSHQIWFIPCHISIRYITIVLKVIRQIEKCTRLQELSKVYYAPIGSLECFGLRECKNQVWPKEKKY